MKKLTFLSAVALSCCAVSPVFAQVQILRSGTPTPAPRLVSDPTNLVEPLPILTPTATPETIPNPFDYFDQQMPQLTPLEPTVEEARPDSFTKDAAAIENQDERDPASLPVARQLGPQRPSVVDTIVSQEALANIPNASVVPVYWGGAAQTPNPVAEWLLREQCVQGLWANYPQQRAAECAQMWNHIHGHHPCGCASGGCATVSGPCTACNSHAPQAPRNRYLERLSAAPKGCDTSAPATACDSCQASPSGPAPGCGQCAQQADRADRADQVGQAANATNVAKLPSLGWFR